MRIRSSSGAVIASMHRIIDTSHGITCPGFSEALRPLFEASRVIRPSMSRPSVSPSPAGGTAPPDACTMRMQDTDIASEFFTEGRRRQHTLRPEIHSVRKVLPQNKILNCSTVSSTSDHSSQGVKQDPERPEHHSPRNTARTHHPERLHSGSPRCSPPPPPRTAPDSAKIAVPPRSWDGGTT